jgi:hypothetical protein
MDNQTIETLLKKNPLTKKYFQGVYPCDKVGNNYYPTKKKKMQLFIVNLDPSYKSGSHWVALLLKEKGKNVYFDSYGLPPNNKYFKKLLKNNYVYSRKKVQHPLSTTCGQWCMYFVWEKSKDKNLKQMLKFFGKDFLANDHIVNLLIEKNFKTDQEIINKPFLKQQFAKTMTENTGREVVL